MLRVSGLSAKATRTPRKGVRRVRLTGRVKGAAGGAVAVSVRRAGRVRATAVLRRPVRRGGRFSHVQRLRRGSYHLQVSYLQVRGVRAVRRFTVR
jgi:hypothetical protein